ncbi:SDR family NAD(P)-dependent oxidoreductase [Oceanicella sp. SM1341]|uniref:SDR family NAD(P)-dependent oxidoreductase n=1 Tax=Oceanicella sp. SM1341 TaxID=1548889 RepID=UPI000E490836|nr:SDR family oxidoreductase [Oceanicella sp. SM1341]
MIDLTGKRALVTGGSRGIGAAIAQTLAENGADVAFTYRNPAGEVEAVAGAIRAAGRRAAVIRADGADPAQIARSVEEAVSALGGLDILVNNAATGHYGMIADLDPDDCQTVLNTNVRGPALYAKAVIPHLGRGGRIVTIGSAAGERLPFAGITLYAMSKAALGAFTRGLARELGPRDITVNLVQPGSTDTASNPADGPAAEAQAAATALGRYGTPREVANAVAFLASPSASVITGATLTADGGAIA